MKEFEIKVPIIGYIKKRISAENKEEAFCITLEEATNDDISDFGIYEELNDETIKKFFEHERKRGNSCKAEYICVK